MRRKGVLPELLAPAGDFASLVAAVSGGADAVYIGGKSFSARAYAKNFDTKEIRSAVRYCHIHGVKLYVALNTLIYDRELTEAVKYAADLYRVGVDALICADIGVITEIKRAIPELEIHASTQMGIHNSLGADEAARLGVSRAVLARELSLADVTAVTESCAIETEVFLHGALCVCHSGQCLLSSLTGGRSGNRGECAQPCRLPYNGKYPLSLKDLSLASHIPALVSSGVASLKIEGRMKSPDYVYRVTKIYRRLLDERRVATEEECCELEAVFSRGGFTDGYVTGKLDGAMTGVRSDGDKDSTKGLSPVELAPKKRSVSGLVRIRSEERTCLTLTLGERSVTVYGEIPEKAISRPLDEAGVRERLCKMGSTNLSLAPTDLICELDGGLNVSPAALNDLRRRAAEELEGCDRDFSLPEDFAVKKRELCRASRLTTALFYDPDEYKRYAEADEYFDIAFLTLFSEVLSAPTDNKKIGAYIPPVITDTEIPLVRKRLEEIKNNGILYALVGNLSHFSLLEGSGFKTIGDARLNVANSASAEFWRERGAWRLICSPEITLPMARDIGEGEIVYGRIPLMLTERCFIKENFGCEKCGSTSLTDRVGMRFPMRKEWQHRNIIFNSVVTYMADKQDELRSFGITHSHFIFSTESSAEIASVVEAYKKRTPPKDSGAVRRIGSLTAKLKSSEQKKKSAPRAKKPLRDAKRNVRRR